MSNQSDTPCERFGRTAPPRHLPIGRDTATNHLDSITSEHLVKTVGEFLIAVTHEETERRHTVGLGPGLLSKIHVPSLTVEFSARRVGFGVFCRRSVLNTGYVQCQVISSHQ